jgi:hypothetical protein
MDKIWQRYNSDQRQLKLDCVDYITKYYLMLGQKPDSEQIVIMSQFLFQDITEKYSNMTFDEIDYAITQGIRNGEGSCFINVRTWNQFIKQHRKQEQIKRQNNLITEYESYKKNQKLISKTITKAKLL